MDGQEALVNPDLYVPKFELESRYQQEIIGMLLNDKVFLSQSLSLIKPEYFTNSAHELICSSLFSYFQQYREIPAIFVLRDALKSNAGKDQGLKLRAFSELDICISCFKPANLARKSCLDKITEFAKIQSLKKAWINATKHLKKVEDETRWQKVENEFREALAVSPAFDLGLDYYYGLDDRFKRQNQAGEAERFITGFSGIDNRLDSKGLCRGEVGAFMGSSGTGKSVMMARICTQNLWSGKKVLYLTLEMNQDKIAKRFDSQIACMQMKELLGQEEKIKNSVENLFGQYQDKRRLMIKQYAPGTMDANMIRAYIAQSRLNGFMPDLIVVDYVGEMRDYEGIKTYESRQKIVRDIRGIAVEENVCVITGLQANRSGREKQAEGVMDDDALADSAGQVRPLDALWSINASKQEQDAGVARIFIAKHRDGESRATVYLKRDPNSLDFIEIDPNEYGKILQNHNMNITDVINPVNAYGKKGN